MDMLTDMVEDLLKAKNGSQVEKAYKALERVGVDRRTAYVMAKELKRMKKENNTNGRSKEEQNQGMPD